LRGEGQLALRSFSAGGDEGEISFNSPYLNVYVLILDCQLPVFVFVIYSSYIVTLLYI
jgi:hypothetical protein